MTIVVDVGCYSHPDHQGASQDSAAALIERFRPSVYFGFDPHPGQKEGVDAVGETVRVFRRAAAWDRDGLTGFTVNGLGSDTHNTTRRENLVPCFDLAWWLRALPFAEEPVVLKLDVEGAEYRLLRRLIDLDMDEFLHLLLVEWHDPPVSAWGDWNRERASRQRLEAALRCPVEEWR